MDSTHRPPVRSCSRRAGTLARSLLPLTLILTLTPPARIQKGCPISRVLCEKWEPQRHAVSPLTLMLTFEDPTRYAAGRSAQNPPPHASPEQHRRDPAFEASTIIARGIKNPHVGTAT